jgi:hypothetical protein
MVAQTITVSYERRRLRLGQRSEVRYGTLSVRYATPEQAFDALTRPES